MIFFEMVIKIELDLVMWCKNGEKCLKRVLTQIDKVIPHDFIHKRIFIDDHSSDDSADIAQNKFDWTVIKNKGRGIGQAANMALSLVDCSYFISFEHDLLLANNWFDEIAWPFFLDRNIAAAQGIRLPDHVLLRKLQEFKIDRIKHDQRMTHSMDNTIYRTQIIRELGGFPNLPGMGVDSILVQKVLNNGYKWLTDFNVISTHLRNGIFQELTHYYKYGLVSPIISMYDPSINLQRMQKTFLYSPLRGIEMAIKKRDPRLVPLYSLIRLMALYGYQKGVV